MADSIWYVLKCFRAIVFCKKCT